MRRILAVGHFLNGDFKGACQTHLGRIRETFFAWPGVLSCRPAPTFTDDLRRRMMDDLRWARQNGIELDTLFNCNCYGDIAVSRELANFVIATLREMDGEGLFPNTVTTTSPFVATVLRKEFPSVKIRWSVNLRVHGTTGFEPVMELFDSFYLSREHHRDLKYVKMMSEWAHNHGKTVGMQANSGCLRQCPFQQFHDNLHGHNRIRQSAIGDEFDFSIFRCATNYERGNYEDFLRATWLRPQDMVEYEPYVDFVKIATRRHPDPIKVLNSYATNLYDGDLGELMDPVPKMPRKFSAVKFDDSSLWKSVRGCPDANSCRHCGKCTLLMKEVFE